MKKVIEIEPRVLFNLTNREITPDNTVRLMYSPKAEVGSEHGQRAIDDFVMLALAKLVKPKSYFEFGTNYGVNLYNLAMNFDDINFYSIDIENFKHVFVGTEYEKRMNIYIGDSTRFNYEPHFGKMDMVFVDGGRDNGIIQSDTVNAFKMLSNKFGCIAWHDYSTIPIVKEYLDCLTEQHEIFHVKDSLIAFYLHNCPAEVSVNLKKQ